MPYSTVVGFGVPPCCTWIEDPVLCGCEAALAIRTALKADGHRCAIGRVLHSSTFWLD